MVKSGNGHWLLVQKNSYATFAGKYSWHGCPLVKKTLHKSWICKYLRLLVKLGLYKTINCQTNPKTQGTPKELTNIKICWYKYFVKGQLFQCTLFFLENRPLFVFWNSPTWLQKTNPKVSTISKFSGFHGYVSGPRCISTNQQLFNDFNSTWLVNSPQQLLSNMKTNIPIKNKNKSMKKSITIRIIETHKKIK